MCAFLIYYYYCYGLMRSPWQLCREQIDGGGVGRDLGRPLRRLLASSRPEEAMVVRMGRRELAEVAICFGDGICRIYFARGGSSSGHLQHPGFWLEALNGCEVPRKESGSQWTFDECRVLSPPSLRFPHSQSAART